MKINKKFIIPNIKRYRDIATKFQEELDEQYEKNEFLKNEVLKMKREEANNSK